MDVVDTTITKDNPQLETKVETLEEECPTVTETETTTGEKNDDGVDKLDEDETNTIEPKQQSPVEEIKSEAPIIETKAKDSPGPEGEGTNTSVSADEASSSSKDDKIKELQEELSISLGKTLILTEERDMLRENSTDKSILEELQKSLEMQMSARAEAEDKLRQETEKRLLLEQMKESHDHTLLEKAKLEAEIEKLRESQEEDKNKITVMTNRINETKKGQSNKEREVKKLETQVNNLAQENTAIKAQLKEITEAKEKLDSFVEKLKAKCVERVKNSEALLQEERTLNEERKKKMKTFVESKAEELRVLKTQKSSISLELETCRKNLISTKELLAQEVNNNEMKDDRIKTLHDSLSRYKRDSEHLRGVGSSLEDELKISLSETEEHKFKRLTAKNELMNVLKKLDNEKSVTGKLKDGIKFTFTPKALSQQQLIQEGIRSLEKEIENLALRLGKPVPNLSPDLEAWATMNSNSNGENSSVATASSDRQKSNKPPRMVRREKSDMDTTRLISNLESETQRVSQGIMAMSTSLERLSLLLKEDEDRGCISVLSDILTNMSHKQTTSADANNNNSYSDSNNNADNGTRAAPSASERRRGRGGGKAYGRVPSSVLDKEVI